MGFFYEENEENLRRRDILAQQSRKRVRNSFPNYSILLEIKDYICIEPINHISNENVNNQNQPHPNNSGIYYQLSN